MSSTPPSSTPPFEGYPFVSPGEGATKVTSIRMEQGAETALYYVTLCSISKKDNRPYDPMAVRILMIMENGEWRIDDIYYYQDAPGAAQAGLNWSLLRGIASYSEALRSINKK